jgi:hypothetical protein
MARTRGSNGSRRCRGSCRASSCTRSFAKCNVTAASTAALSRVRSIKVCSCFCRFGVVDDADADSRSVGLCVRFALDRRRVWTAAAPPCWPRLPLPLLRWLLSPSEEVDDCCDDRPRRPVNVAAAPAACSSSSMSSAAAGCSRSCCWCWYWCCSCCCCCLPPASTSMGCTPLCRGASLKSSAGGVCGGSSAPASTGCCVEDLLCAMVVARIDQACSSVWCLHEAWMSAR